MDDEHSQRLVVSFQDLNRLCCVWSSRWKANQSVFSALADIWKKVTWHGHVQLLFNALKMCYLGKKTKQKNPHKKQCFHLHVGQWRWCSALLIVLIRSPASTSHQNNSEVCWGFSNGSAKKIFWVCVCVGGGYGISAFWVLNRLFIYLFSLGRVPAAIPHPSGNQSCKVRSCTDFHSEEFSPQTADFLNNQHCNNYI